MNNDRGSKETSTGGMDFDHILQTKSKKSPAVHSETKTNKTELELAPLPPPTVKEKPRNVSAPASAKKEVRRKSAGGNDADFDKAIEKQQKLQEGESCMEEARKAFDAKDYQTFLKYLSAAVERENPTALMVAGQLYENGEFGIDRDLKKAEQYYQAAIELGCEEAKKKLQELYAEHQKTFGPGKMVTLFLHLPSVLFGMVFAWLLMSVLFLGIPILLLVVRGNLYFWKVPPTWTMGAGCVWLTVSLLVMSRFFKRIYYAHVKFGIAVFEWIFSFIYRLCTKLIAIAVGVGVCFLESRLLVYLSGKIAWCVANPFLTKVIIAVIMLITGLAAFMIGYLIIELIAEDIKEKTNEYY